MCGCGCSGDSAGSKVSGSSTGAAAFVAAELDGASAAQTNAAADRIVTVATTHLDLASRMEMVLSISAESAALFIVILATEQIMEENTKTQRRDKNAKAQNKS
jgi:hypothetical protein